MTSQPQHHCRYAGRIQPLRYVSKVLCGYLWSVTNRHITLPCLPRSSLADDCRKGWGECQPFPAALATNLPFDVPFTNYREKKLKLNGNALFLRNFKRKVGKITRRGGAPKAPCHSEPFASLHSKLESPCPTDNLILTAGAKQVTPLLGTKEKHQSLLLTQRC